MLYILFMKLQHKLTHTFTIKQILKDHWHHFVNLGYDLRPAILKNVQKVIHCGDPSLGYALYSCSHCGKIKHVPFRCKSRFCNTCGTSYVSNRAKNISSKLINCKHRHLVFTIPAELRKFFRLDRSLLNVLFQACSSTVLSWFHQLNKSEHFIPGFISTLHTFGRDLKWNPHIHMILSEGASGNFTVWRSIQHFPFTMLRRRFQTTLLHMLHQHLGPSFEPLKSFLFATYKDGFYVRAKKEKQSVAKNSIDYIVRYTGRPAMAQSRILDYDGLSVTFYYERHEDGERVVETLSAIDFIKRLIIHIPDEQFKMVRYYGLYAKKYKHSSKLFLMVSSSKKKFWDTYFNWRSRILLAFGTDPLKCSCGHTFELIDIFFPKNSPLLDSTQPPPYNLS